MKAGLSKQFLLRHSSLSLVLLLLGCRHSAPIPPSSGATSGKFPVIVGDPATNVMVVPMSAAWELRGGGTTNLPPGIHSPQPFPFPEYDQTLVRSVYQKWQNLLEAQPQPAQKGEVVVEFQLHDDGSISRLKMLPSEVSPRLELLCQQAILQSAPFPEWTPAMKEEMKADTRLIRISFNNEIASSLRSEAPEGAVGK